MKLFIHSLLKQVDQLSPTIDSESDLEKENLAALRRKQLSLVLAGKMNANEATELKALFLMIKYHYPVHLFGTTVLKDKIKNTFSDFVCKNLSYLLISLNNLTFFTIF